MLVLCLVVLRGRSGPQILHNWTASSSRFTADFAQRLAPKVRAGLGSSDILMPAECSTTIKVLSLVPATILFCLPLPLILLVARVFTPGRVDVIAIFCDAHLSGFAVSAAMKVKKAETLTLQHGLYRSDDRGSAMALRNFISDRILLWDQATFDEFRHVGHDSNRLRMVGQYGFVDATPSGASDSGLVLFCPPYDLSKVADFGKIEKLVPKSTAVKWSLHPMLRKECAQYDQAALATVLPKPKLAVCGDSGVIMDSLARSIPVISVSERKLAAAHITYEDISSLDALGFERLAERALEGLSADQAAFGFDAPKDFLVTSDVRDV